MTTSLLTEISTQGNVLPEIVGQYMVLPTIPRITQYKLEFAWGLDPGDFIFTGFDNVISVRHDIADLIIDRKCILLPTPEIIADLDKYIKGNFRVHLDERVSLQDAFPMEEREYLLFPVGIDIPLYANGQPLAYPHNATGDQIGSVVLPRVKSLANPACVAFKAGNVLRRVAGFQDAREEFQPLVYLFRYYLSLPPKDFYQDLPEAEILKIEEERMAYARGGVYTPHPDRHLYL